MKKLLFVLLVATITVSCTKTDLQDETHPQNLQVIKKADGQGVDKTKIERPGDQGGN